MKINFGHDDFKAIYRVGNVIKDRAGFIYLIVEKEERGYTVVNLTNNEIYASYDTMQALIHDFAEQGQALVNAELTIL
ncbi:hypothetical protein [Ligilactobacillus salivarius]|uniref:hypothetical protein n=1 Tax=Ligilactobacillus salivarius TaxID=1624 RepID=UPI0009DAC878|nr:hypothetical protein [Ligilactobacillus salivarius]OQR18437.1 hypothetical protein B6U39_10875 [Ligilactobacillus salivarius]